MTSSRFLLHFLIFSLLIAVLPLYLQFSYPEWLLFNFWALFAIFAIFTFSILSLAFWFMRIDVKASGQALLGTVVFRLLFCMVLAFVYLFNFDEDKVVFVSNFFYLYLSHTVFEIYCLLRNLRT